MEHALSRFKFCWSWCMCTWCCCHQWCAQGYDDKLMHEWQGLSSSTYKLCTNIFSKKHTWVFDHSSRSRLSKYVLTIKRLMDVTCMKNKNCQEFHTDYFHCGRQLLQLSKEVAKHQWLNVIDSHDKRTYVGFFVDTSTVIGCHKKVEVSQSISLLTWNWHAHCDVVQKPMKDMIYSSLGDGVV